MNPPACRNQRTPVMHECWGVSVHCFAGRTTHRITGTMAGCLFIMGALKGRKTGDVATVSTSSPDRSPYLRSVLDRPHGRALLDPTNADQCLPSSANPANAAAGLVCGARLRARQANHVRNASPCGPGV